MRSDGVDREREDEAGAGGAQHPLDDVPEQVWKNAARRRLAFHEAGHAYAQILLTGDPPQLVSLRPGLAYAGVSVGGSRPGWARDLNLDVASILQPADLRRAFEINVAVILAGDVAERLAGYGRTGYQPDLTEDEATAATASKTLAGLSPRHRELLDRMEASPTMTPDTEASHASSFALTGSDAEAGAHVSWLATVVQRLFADHAAGLQRLADSLLADEVLDGGGVLRVARTVRCACHVWPNTPTEENSNVKVHRAPPTPGRDTTSYQVITGLALDVPGGTWCPRVGSVWPGRHPGVRQLRRNGGLGTLIVEAGADERPIARPASAAMQPRPAEPTPAARPRLVRAIRRVEYQAGIAASRIGEIELPNSDGRTETATITRMPMPLLQTAEVGAIVSADHPIVAFAPDSFEPMPEPAA